MDVLVLSSLLGAKFWSNGGVDPLFILKLVLLWKLLQSKNTVFQAVDRTHPQVCRSPFDQATGRLCVIEQHKVINNCQLIFTLKSLNEFSKQNILGNIYIDHPARSQAMGLCKYKHIAKERLSFALKTVLMGIKTSPVKIKAASGF